MLESLPLPGGRRRFVAWDSPGASGGAAAVDRLRAALVARGEDDAASAVPEATEFGVRRFTARGMRNGGLLVGNMLTRYPELFGAIVCEVPLLDMERYTQISAGASWIAEYGDPQDPEEWAFIREFSPYHNLSPAKKYPPVAGIFINGGELLLRGEACGGFVPVDHVPECFDVLRTHVLIIQVISMLPYIKT